MLRASVCGARRPRAVEGCIVTGLQWPAYWKEHINRACPQQRLYGTFLSENPVSSVGKKNLKRVNSFVI